MMDINQYSLRDLFAQLGLANTKADIRSFVAQHPLAASISLTKAPFWSHAQATFMQEAWREDADWCGAIDELNNLLHQPH